VTARNIDILIRGRNEAGRAFQQAQAQADRFATALVRRFASVTAIAMSLDRGFREVAKTMEQMRNDGSSIQDITAQTYVNVVKTIPIVGGIASIVEQIHGSWTGAAAEAERHEAMLARQNDRLKEQQQRQQSLQRLMAGLRQQVDMEVGGVSREQVLLRQIEALDRMGHATVQAHDLLRQLADARELQSMRSEIHGLTETLETQIATFGMSSDELARWRIEQFQASIAGSQFADQLDISIQHAKELTEEFARLRREQQEMQQAQSLVDRIMERGRTAIDRYNDELKALRENLKAGRISQEEFARASEQVRRDIEAAQARQTGPARRGLQFEEGRLLTRAPGREDPQQRMVKLAENQDKSLKEIKKSNNKIERLLDIINSSSLIVRRSNLS
jgi:uncharacterized phage infection (PIP) family protein YhgE